MDRTLLLVDLNELIGALPPLEVPLDGKSVKKSAATLIREAVIEYSRIVFDLYAGESKLAVMLAGEQDKVLVDWTTNSLHLRHLMEKLQSTPRNNHGLPTADVFHSALQLLAAPLEGRVLPPRNRTRILFLTAATCFKTDDLFRYHCSRAGYDIDLRDLIGRLLQPYKWSESGRKKNDFTSSSRALWPITHCDVQIIAVSGPGFSLPSQRQEISTQMTIRSYIAPSHLILPIARRLAQTHLNLGVISIRNIPMKETQASAERRDYEVSLYFIQTDHVPVIPSTLISKNELSSEDLDLQHLGYADAPTSLVLSWSQKTKASQEARFRCVHRVTPKEVTSSPAACLIKYVTGNKTVFASVFCAPVISPVPRNADISHRIVNIDGEIVIQCLHFSASPEQLNFHPLMPSLDGLRHDDFISVIDVNNLSGVLSFGMSTGSSVAPTPATMNNTWLMALPEPPAPVVGVALERSTKNWPVLVKLSILERIWAGNETNLKEGMRRLKAIVLKPDAQPHEIDTAQKIIRSFVAQRVMRKEIDLLAAVEPIIPNAYHRFWDELLGWIDRYGNAKMHVIMETAIVAVAQAEEEKMPLSAASTQKIEASPSVLSAQPSSPTPLPTVPASSGKRKNTDVKTDLAKEAMQQLRAINNMTTRERQDLLSDDYSDKKPTGPNKAYLQPRNLMSPEVDLGPQKSLLYQSWTKHQQMKKPRTDFDGRATAAVVNSTSVSDPSDKFTGPQSYE